MRRSLLLPGLLAAFASGCYLSPGPLPGPLPTDDGTITIDNGSSSVLTEVRVTAVQSSSWGPNLLGGDILYPNERLTVGVACGTYDVLVVDEYDRDCVLGNIDLCLADQVWVIDDSTLRYCAY